LRKFGGRVRIRIGGVSFSFFTFFFFFLQFNGFVQGRRRNKQRKVRIRGGRVERLRMEKETLSLEALFARAKEMLGKRKGSKDWT
jgi:hypothetical protein